MGNKKFYFAFIAIVLLPVVFISGCTSDTEYMPPSKVESTQSGGETSSESPTTAPSEPETELELPKTQTFNVGDTATDNELKVTVNNVKFVSKIDEKEMSFWLPKHHLENNMQLLI